LLEKIEMTIPLLYIGKVFTALSQTETALVILEKSKALALQQHSFEHPAMPEILAALALAEPNYKKALEHAESALAIKRKLQSQTPPNKFIYETFRIECIIAHLYMKAGVLHNAKEIIADLNRRVDALKESSEWAVIEFQPYVTDMEGLYHEYDQDKVKAIAIYNDSLSLKRAIFAEPSIEIMSSLYALHHLYRETGDAVKMKEIHDTITTTPFSRAGMKILETKDDVIMFPWFIRSTPPSSILI